MPQAFAGSGPQSSTLPASSDATLQQINQGVQQIIALLQKLAQGDDDTSFGEHEVDHDEYASPGTTGAAASQSRSGSDYNPIHAALQGRGGPDPKAPPKQDDPFEKANGFLDWIGPGNQALVKALGAIL
jgi:hypothetical protein